MYADGDGGAFDYGEWHDLQVEKEQDIINEYAYDLDRYDTYEELVAALRGDERIKYPEGDAYYLELATEVISKADCVVCDCCSHIVSCDDAFCADYPDVDGDYKVAQALGDSESVICMRCYNKILKGETNE